jgi:uncharacterized protein YndB with AHSA1/START domain
MTCPTPAPAAAGAEEKGTEPMSHLVSTIEIDRPPDEVFAYLTDPTRFPDWQPDVLSVRMETGRWDVGSRFTTTRRIGHTDRTMTQEVTHHDPPTSWAVNGVDGPIRPHASITVDPLDDGMRSRVTFTLGFEGHGIGIPLVPMINRMAAKAAPTSYDNAKRLLEGRQHLPGQVHDQGPSGDPR